MINDCEYKENDSESEKKAQKLRHVLNELKSYGGVLSKLSQIISINDENNKVYSDCKPFSTNKTIKYFKKICSQNEKIKSEVTDIDYKVYKSGSVGQLHIGKYKNSVIAFKVQYAGLLEQTMSDLKLVDFICSYLFNFSNIKNAITDVKNKMNEELDYKIEAVNHKKMMDIYVDDKDINIPYIIPELCTDKILCTEFIEGTNLASFIKTATEKEKHSIGVNIIKFIFKNIYKHGILYSDIHYGNFLIKERELYVVDFGCLTYLGEDLKDNLVKLYKALDDGDKKNFFKTVAVMGILVDKTSEESKKYMYDYFLLQYQPWIQDNFEFTDEWLDKITTLNQELMDEWVLPENMVYFNKLPHTLCYILTKLKLKGDFRHIIKEFIK